MLAGRSQRAVLDYVTEIGRPVAAWEVGEALYAKTSSCAFSVALSSNLDRIKRSWAGKILNQLTDRGYLVRHPAPVPTYTVKKSSVTPSVPTFEI